MYRLVFSSIAKQQFSSIYNRYTSALAKALKRLQENPHIGQPLTGQLKGRWKLRFSRYRIIYKINEQEIVVFVIAIGHRRDIYRAF